MVQVAVQRWSEWHVSGNVLVRASDVTHKHGCYIDGWDGPGFENQKFPIDNFAKGTRDARLSFHKMKQ